MISGVLVGKWFVCSGLGFVTGTCGGNRRNSVGGLVGRQARQLQIRTNLNGASAARIANSREAADETALGLPISYGRVRKAVLDYRIRRVVWDEITHWRGEAARIRGGLEAL